MTELEYQTLCARARAIAQHSEGKRAGIPKPKRPEPVSGPLSVLLTLHGHCPSKKNLWKRGQAGVIYLDSYVKDEIANLTCMAMLGWKYPGPVEHPALTVTFFIAAARQDQDGMYTTVLDCLQAAGVIVNDNIAHFNGRKVLEPCVFVSESEERVEILVEKK